jgi:hypothetical protein
MAAKLPLLCFCLNGGRDWLTPRAREVNTDMPGWDSLEAVTQIHSAAQIAGFVLLAVLLLGAVLLVRQLRRSGWPEWIDIGSYQVRSVAFEIAAAVLLVMLVAVALVAVGYDVRRHTLMAAAEQMRADQLRRQADDARTRQADETQGRPADEIHARQAVASAQQQGFGESAILQRKVSETEHQVTDLQRKLAETESRVTELQRKFSESGSQLAQTQRELSDANNQRAELQRKLSESEKRVAELQRKPPIENQTAELQRKLTETEKQLAALQRKELEKRLSEEEKKRLIEALRPFRGQKVTIAARLGDEDGKALAEDLVAVFEAAGWDHDGNGGISVQRWDRDPVGVEITLNEADARAGRISSGIGALINAVRKLGLSYDNTIYMNRQVPSGQALVKVGRKLAK